MGQVNFLSLGLGFGLFDCAWVGFWVFGFFLRLTDFFFSGSCFFLKSCILEQKLTQIKKKILAVGSGPPKITRGQVGQNTLGSVF